MKIKDRIIDFKRVKASSLHPHPRNWRTHPDNQKDALKGVLAEIGYADALVVRKDGNGFQILDGHLRAETTPDAQVPILVTDLNDDEADKFLVTHDPLGALATTDDDNLKHLLAGVDTGSQALTKMLEDMADFDITPNDGLTDEDDAPETPADPITKPGDLILLGDHRLLCGDSTNADDVARLMDGKEAVCVFTDPPYGVNVEGGKSKTHIAGDLTQTAIPLSFEHAVQAATTKRAWIYFCGGEGNLGLYSKLFERYLQQLPKHLIWVKNGFVMRANGYHSQYELIFCGFKIGGGAQWYGGRKEDEASDVWHIDRDPSSSYQHPTQKPVALPLRAIKNSSQEGDIVFDPFLGSGPTLIAAEQLKRVCFGMEIDPAYCDVIVQRWENYTGKKAERKTEPQLAGV